MAFCSSCGSYIGDDQGSSCSMCYGDPYHGSDGYYLQWMEEQERIAQERRYNEQMEYEHARMMEEICENENQWDILSCYRKDITYEYL